MRGKEAVSKTGGKQFIHQFETFAEDLHFRKKKKKTCHRKQKQRKNKRRGKKALNNYY